jgi:hypothetical protein
MAPDPSVLAAQVQVMVPVEPWLEFVVTEGLGTDGTPEGPAASEGLEKAPVPTELVAATSKMYDVPSLSPVTL